MYENIDVIFLKRIDRPFLKSIELLEYENIVSIHMLYPYALLDRQFVKHMAGNLSRGGSQARSFLQFSWRIEAVRGQMGAWHQQE